MLSATDLAKNLAAAAEISQANAKIVLDHAFQCIFDAVTDPAVGGVRTSIGTFELIQRDSRQARNPRTGETITVGPSYAPKFKFSSTVKKAVKELKVAKKGKATAVAAPAAKATAKPAAKGKVAAAAPARGKAVAAPAKAGKGKAAAPVAKAAKQAAPAKAPAKAVAAKGKPGKGKAPAKRR